MPSILVNNAGIDQPPDSATDRFHIEDMPVELFRRMVDVNLVGTFQMIQVFGALMVGRRRGAIVNIGSLYASVSPDQRFYDHFEGQPPFLKVPAYGASKAAVVNMTKYFATLWGPYDVRVNTLSPGGVLGVAGRQFQAQVRGSCAARQDGGRRRSERPAGVPGVQRVVVRHRPRASRGRWIHRMVTPGARARHPSAASQPDRRNGSSRRGRRDVRQAQSATTAP